MNQQLYGSGSFVLTCICSSKGVRQQNILDIIQTSTKYSNMRASYQYRWPNGPARGPQVLARPKHSTSRWPSCPGRPGTGCRSVLGLKARPNRQHGHNPNY
uniref:Uncharacterized protein n=1 Tax=Arundo donax TaxID=35708 RepID=A0A0A9CK87_ARUDO